MEQPLTPDTPPKHRGLSGSTIKLIAIFTMLIDHTGSAILGRMLAQTGLLSLSTPTAYIQWISAHAPLYYSYTATRLIGRIAFPIFCFLLVEGFQKTHDVKKYAFRLALFALISEIPFDLAFQNEVLEFTYQNVYFTLFFGLLCMIVLHTIQEKITMSSTIATLLLHIVLGALDILAFCYLAEAIFHTDYGWRGIACIMILYLFRNKKPCMIVAGCISFCWESTAPLAFIPIGFYNGKRGLKLKYVFYAFYPVHLFLLYLLAQLMGLGGYSAL